MKKPLGDKPAIVVKGLQKSYGKLKVLDGVSFSVPQGTILALLGPNGAGKTTTIRILSTLLQPDGGSASINGHDVVKDSEKVHASIGLTGQYAAVDEYLTGEENLHMIGRLYRLSPEDTRQRTSELLEQFDLVDSAKRPVKQYSGGMKRRIDLAMSLIASPPVIFLDEPTTGLDPRSRLTMWDMIKKMAKSGTTILLTTQYMDEADHLADNIVVIDDGKVIAEGTADTLKAKVGADRLEVTIGKKSSFDKAAEVLKAEKPQIDRDRRTINIASKGGVSKLKAVLQQLESAKIEVESISLHRPTLDDVFMSLTGHIATAEEQEAKPKGKK
ncbi:MAG: ATP-binding cassette domain-containing protein [Patescibacteria group bacterium]